MQHQAYYEFKINTLENYIIKKKKVISMLSKVSYTYHYNV